MPKCLKGRLPLPKILQYNIYMEAEHNAFLSSILYYLFCTSFYLFISVLNSIFENTISKISWIKWII